MVFRVTSTAFEDGGRLPHAQLLNGMGQDGANLSPALAWQDPPDGTLSFAVTAYDPDAPTGSGWWHWVVVNLPAELRTLPEGAGSVPGGLPWGAVQTRTDFGKPGYGGAAPPPGDQHRYVFTVHALKVGAMDVSADMSGAMVGFMLNAQRIGSASVTAVFGT